MRALAGRAGWPALVAVGLLIGVVAGRYVIDRPTTSEDTARSPQIYVVGQGTVGRTLRLPGTAAWDVISAVPFQGSGVVTEVVRSAGLFAPGDIVLRVNERPVVVLPGEVPAFRELRIGSVGRDVAAVQRYLAGLGYAVDATVDDFTSVTAAAVQRWQEILGLPSTGVIALGDVVFIPETAFAAPLRWADGVRLGATLVQGAPILERLATTPTVTVEFGGGSPPDQLEQGLAGEVAFANGALRDVVLSEIHFDIGRRWATAEPTEGVLCEREECLELVPAVGDTPVDITFTLVPQTTGPLVPVAALQSDATGQAFVELPDGTRRSVTIRVVSGGTAIVEGVAVGDQIVLP